MQPIDPPNRINVGHRLDRRTCSREFQETILGDYHVLYLPLCRGDAAITTNGKTLHVGSVFPGMMRLASPGESIHTVVHSALEAVAVTIPGEVMSAAVQAVGGRHEPGNVSYINALVNPNPQVAQLGRALLQAERLDTAHAQLFVDGLTHALLACLLYHHGTKTCDPRSAMGLDAAQFKRAEAHALAHLEGKLKLDDWAAALGMLTGEFTRRFRHTAGMSPYAWYIHQRIGHAKMLLRRSKFSLCEVALRCGFSSQSHFTEAFRRHIGTSPARWRDAQR